MIKSNILSYFGKGLKADPGILNAITDKYLKTSDLNVSSRVLNYWKNHQLLLDEPENWKYEHLHFSFLDYVWFNMIKELREYDISIRVIKNIKKGLISTMPFSFILESGALEYYAKTLPEDKRDDFMDAIHDPEFLKDLKNDFKKSGIKMNILNILVIYAIIFKRHVSLMIDKKGDVYPFNLDFFNDLIEDSDYKTLFLSSHISISISEIIVRFIKNAKLDFISDKLFLLSGREAQIIKILREEEISSLKVYLENDKEIKLLETTKEFNKIDAESRLLDFMIKDGYQTIEIKTQAGTPVYCRNIRKIKPI